MNEEMKLSEGLGLAETMCGHAFCADACTEDQMRAAVDAIRTEHAQRLTLQHHAADLAQRVADLERERDEWRQLASAHSPAKELAASLKQAKASGEATRKERDELRARLAELERQEPVGYMLRSSAGFPHPEVVRDISYLSASTAENVICGRNHLDPIYARPVHAIPEGWKPAPVNPTEKMISEGACASCLPGPHYIGEDAARRAYINMIAAAPEHKS